jgi:hypothetical protein
MIHAMYKSSCEMDAIFCIDQRTGSPLEDSDEETDEKEVPVQSLVYYRVAYLLLFHAYL